MPEARRSCFREFSGYISTSAGPCCFAHAVITGSRLAEEFHREVVGPLLAASFPTIGYAAARLGSGSDVLGYDDDRSRDHDWGCRLTVLVDEAYASAVPRIRQVLADHLPAAYAGHPVRVPVTWDQTTSHNVEVATVYDFAASRLGVRPATTGYAESGAPGGGRPGLPTLDWLVVSGQGALEVVAGP